MEKTIFQKVHELQKNNWWFGNARNKLVGELLEKYIPDYKNLKALDVGCSEGAFLDYMSDKQVDVKAIDIDNNAIEFCKERGYGDQVRYGSLLDIPYKDETFDIVFLLDIIEHVQDDYKAISEVNRVLGPKGSAILIVPAYQWLWSNNDVAYHHKRRYSISLVKKLVKSKDFKLTFISFFNSLLFPVFVIFTMIAKFSRRSSNSTVVKPVPKSVNFLLIKLMQFERWLIVNTGIKLPFGSSIILLVTK